MKAAIKAIRGMGVMIGTSFRASPGLATLVFVLTAVSSLGGAASAYGIKLLVEAITGGNQDAMVRSAGFIALVLGGTSVTSIGISTVRMSMEERTRLYMERRVLQLAGGLPGIEHHERPEYANEIQLLRGSQGILSQPAGPLVFIFSSIVSGVGTLGLLAQLDSRLLLLPIFGIPSLIAGGFSTRISRKAQEQTVERQRLAWVFHNLATSERPAKEVRIFGLGKELRRRLDELQSEILQETTRAASKGSLLSAMGWTFFAAGYVGAIALVASNAIRGSATLGDVVMTMTLAGQVNGLVAGAVANISWLGSSLRVVGRYLWLLDYSREARPSVKDPAPVPRSIAHGIQFENVSFTYAQSEKPALSSVDLDIPAGTTLAIVGDNGAGKTTLVKLLCRFYSPTEGTISIDGIDLQRLDFEEWRRRITGGFQDFARLEFIARESVGVGDLPRIDEVPAVQEALTRAAASDVMTALPTGLDTQLGKQFEGGVELSTGQWQKLALGRAMMRDEPLVLILDEPTASLDAHTEHALFERYAHGAKRAATASGAITILVSHRFSTVRMADRIVVIDEGKIAEVGSHEELIRAGGLYAELYGIQASRYR